MATLRSCASIAAILLFISTQAFAAGDFNAWLQGVKTEALNKGISQQTVNTALADVTPIQRVIELDRKQPEGTMTFAKYKKNVITKDRIDKGRRLYQQHHSELQRAAKHYGVPAQYIVALWGIETSYGQNTGGFGVIPALATLAYDGRRSEYFRKELINALEILDQGHISLTNMRGSWAGAMGQNQFMPTSFKRFAVDGNNDGKRDIWTSLPDVFASTANYLSTSGWKEDEIWGREVSLPKGFPKSLTGIENKKTLLEWSHMGITMPNGHPLPSAPGMKASIIAPDGTDGPAYLAYDNYKVIMSWNKSVYFATSVGILADQIAR